MSPGLLQLDNVKLKPLYSNILDILLPDSAQEGDSLLVNSGKIQLPVALTEDFLKKMKSIHSEIDNELLLKAGNALIAGKVVLQKTFHILLDNDQELLKVHLQHLIHSYNSRLTVLKEKLETIEELNEDDDSESLASVSKKVITELALDMVLNVKSTFKLTGMPDEVDLT
jgi:hypothetical protein